MFRKPILLCFLLGLCLVLANAQEVQEEPTEIKGPQEPQEPEEPQEEVEPEVATELPEEATELPLEEELEGEGEEIVELCTYNHVERGEIQITYEIISETEDKVLEVTPVGEEDPQKVLEECLSLQDLESRSRRRNQLIKRRRKVNAKRRRKPTRKNKPRKQKIVKRRRNQITKRKRNNRRKAQQKNRRRQNSNNSRRNQQLTYEQQTVVQIRKILDDNDITRNPDGLNRIIKLTQNLLLRAVGEEPMDGAGE